MRCPKPSRHAAVLTRFFLCALAALVLAGCAGRSSHVRRGYGGPATQRPYTVKGVTYTPLPTGKGYNEVGIASWYGPGFHGHTTSSGEIYDQYQLTCAHKLLPMHTMVRVTNQRDGSSAVLRVNDRGPFVAGRIIDLSLAAAKKLGVYGRGTAMVRVQTEGEVPGAMPNGDLPGPFYVQVGAFANRENAERLYGRMRASGFAGSRIDDKDFGGNRLFRVHAGTFATMQEAEQARQRLARTYYGAFILAQ